VLIHREDSIDDLEARIHATEHKLLVDALHRLIVN
jgi:folate-dependent phosphoribosylglycinamide formyltransferase PurN